MTTTDIKVADLISNAAILAGDGQGGEITDNAEYLRGMVELICLAAGLPCDEHRDSIIEAIKGYEALLATKMSSAIDRDTEAVLQEGSK